MATPVDFRKYLQFLVESYKKQQDIYTLTDLQVEVEVEIPPEDSSQPRSPENKPETKIERLEVLAGLRKYVQQGNVLLVGKPGSGKSTVLQRFRWELAREALKDRDRQIPVLVQLRSDRSILEAICAEFRQAKLRVRLEEVDDLLLERKLLLLLDGLDEMPSQQRRQDLHLFRDDNPDTPMIFTTRDLVLGGSLGIEKQLEMCALTEAQIREFVHKQLPQHGDLLLRQLRDRLREIAETPLLLEMMCKVFKNTGKILQSKGELFQEFDRQYEEFKGGASVSEDFRHFKSEVLQQLAFVMLQGDSQRPTDGWVAISRDRAEGILEGWLRHRRVVDAPTKAKEWLEDLLEHHLLQVAAKPEEIEFHHPLFQEYYAGRALLKLFDEKHPDAMDDQRLQHFYLNYFKWTEPLAFMLSLLREEVQAVRVVRLALDVDLMLGARLAGEVQREFQKRTVGLVDRLDVPGWLKVELLGVTRSDEAIPRLLKLVEDSDSDVRWSAVSALGAIGDAEAIPGLLKLVEHSDSDVRRRAADALGKIGDAHAIPGLLKLVEHSDSDVRRMAADALGKIGDEKAIPVLLKLLEDSDSSVRSSAAGALGKIGDAQAIPGLLKLLEDSDSFVRWRAADALGNIGDAQAIPGLLKLVEDSESYVRSRAADALGNIGDAQAIPGLLKLFEHSHSDVRSRAADALGNIGDAHAIPGLLKLVEHSHSDVRRMAANALGKIGDGRAIPGLLKLLEHSKYSVRKMAVDALGNIGDAHAIPGLLKLVEHSHSDVRRMAANALGKIGDYRAIPGLLKLVEHSDYSVRRMAADPLGKIGDAQAIPGLLKLVEDSDSSVRSRAVDALGKIGDAQAIPRLLKLVEHSDYSVRRRAADALGNIGDAQAIPGLLKLVEHSDSDVRRRAADALGKIGDAHAIPGLLKLVKDSDYFVRWRAADALGKIGDAHAIPGLLKLVEDSESDVRWSATGALGNIGDAQAIPGLLKLVEHSHSDVRRRAADALGNIGDAHAIPGLLKLVEHSDSSVRRRAADALGNIGDAHAIPGLLKLVKDSDYFVRRRAADALGKIAKQHAEKVAPHLPHLLSLIPSKSGKEFHRLILAIQAACKYYNYEIRQLSLAPHPAKPSQPTELLVKIDQTTQQIHKTTKQMADQPTQDFSHATFEAFVNFGTNHGHQAHHLHIAAQQSSPEAALNAVVQIIQALEKKYTYVQDEEQARNIIDAEYKEIKQQKPIEWQNLISLQRLYNGAKNAAVKVGEHFAESSVWGKAGVGFIEGISEDVN
jgi:HEAT repeat protein